MIVKIRIPRFASAGASEGPEALATEPLRLVSMEPLHPLGAEPLRPVAAEPVRSVSTFHVALTDSAEDWAVRGTPQAAFTPRPEPSVMKQRGPGPGFGARAWAWVQTRYAQTAIKRLRVAETVSLGEKRFVSIVNVEGREFLIGGGASGVTLLAQLGPMQEMKGSGMRTVREDAA
jgi:hypothetical protein